MSAPRFAVASGTIERENRPEWVDEYGRRRHVGHDVFNATIHIAGMTQAECEALAMVLREGGFLTVG